MNEILNVDMLNNTFLKNGIVRIYDFLTTSSAEQLRQCLESKIDYANAFHLAGMNRQASDDEIAKLNNETRLGLYNDIYKAAAKGSGFLYGRHKIEPDSKPELTNALSLLNSAHMLDLIKVITNKNSLTHADGQATRFRVGDFLTRHVDDIPGETRQIAYVLGMTENWHPDWGGLLQFFEKSGQPTDSWSPTFNSLTLFDVNKIHSVTSIAPFSEKKRYSITGWFRS